MTEWWKQFRRRLSAGGRDRVLPWLMGAGIAGILLIALSEWLPTRQPSPTDPSAALTVTGLQVEQALEQRITTLLSAVEGVGRCQVMVTLESGEQTLYAADTTHTVGADGATTSSESYLTVDTATGPVGLLLTRIQPTVKGVAVVCEGADDPAVCQRVQAVITTAFHISERRVCVVQQK